MRDPAPAPAAPRLSDDLTRFASELEAIRAGDYAASPDGVASLVAAMAGVMRMFAVDAQRLEHHLELADARIACLRTTDYAGDLVRDLAIRDGVRDGSVIDVREAFLAAQSVACSLRASNDGGAA